MSSAPFEIDVDALNALPDEERAEELRRIAVLKRELEGNPLWSYIPHEGELGWKRREGHPVIGGEQRGQVAYHEASRDGVYLSALIGGNRAGKSEGGFADNLVQILPPEFVPPWLAGFRVKPYTGDYRCRTVCVDIPNALNKVLIPKLRKMVPPAALLKGSWEKAWNDRNRMLTFADGSWWDFLTHDMDIDAFAGADVDRIHFDEEPPGTKGKLQWDESEARLIDRDGDVRLTMTPLLGLSFVYYEITEHDQLRFDDEVRVVEVSMEHNPYLPRRQQDRLRKKWSKNPLTLEARMHGRFVHFEGLVYEEWRDDRHIRPDHPIPRRDEKSRPVVPIYAAIDPGIDHPAALVFFWVDSEDVAVVFYAQKWQGAIVADIAKEYKRVCETLNFAPRWTVIDPAARNRNHQTGRSIQQEFTEHGVATLPGQNAREAGYDRVKERLRTDRLLVHASCDQLIDEFKSYRWKRRRASQTEEPGRAGEVIKTNDDCFVAGTLVWTEDGERPVEDVRLGDRVWTRDGLRTVVAAGLRRDAEPQRVIRAELSNGRALTGTADHLVFVQDRGFVPLGSLRYSDMLVSCLEPSESSLTECPTGAIPTPSMPLTATTSQRPATGRRRGESQPCIERSGAITTARSLRAVTSTTATATRSTTTSRTSCVSPPPSTSESTGPLSAPRPPDVTWMTSVPSPPTGTAAPKGGPGTPCTAVRHGLTASRDGGFAITVAPSTTTSPPVVSARTAARRRLGERPASMSRFECAKPAAPSSQSTSTPSNVPAPVRVLGLSDAGTALVYNLTVYGSPEYFAEGVLVHNCLDALRYGLMSMPVAAPRERDPERDESPAQRAFREDIRRLGRRRRVRVGSRVT